MSARRKRNEAALELDPERLHAMSVSELRALWTLNMACVRAPSQSRLMVRDLAWRVQERRHGGLDSETSTLLEAAIRSVQRDRAEGRLGPRTPRPSVGPLPASARLVRPWNGAMHEVEVLEGGRSFRYRGEVYSSLSHVARVITGSHRSGPKFFGLTTRSKAASDHALPQRRRPER